MVGMTILGTVSEQREMNGTDGGCLAFGKYRQGEALYISAGVLCTRSLFFQSLCGS